MSERLLLLETSGRTGLVAVAQGDAVLARRRLDESRRNARDLAPAVAELLAEQGWAARDLAAVVVGRGPGSYTGLRVGLMAAKTLAYVTGCALVAVETFAVVARQSPAECARVDVLADAQKDLIYVQAFQRAEGGWRALADLAIIPYSDWLAGRDPLAWVSGPGLRKVHDRLPVDVRVVPEAHREPGVDALLALGRERLAAGQTDDPFVAEPLYLRASSAELQWRGRGEP